MSMPDPHHHSRTHSWTALPDELLQMALTTLPTEALARAAGVSRSWRATAMPEIYRRGWTRQNWRRTHHMVCSFCRVNRACKRFSSGKRECTACRDMPGNRLVTKGRAVSEFNVQPTLLHRLPCIILPNPHGGEHQMRLYRVSDLWTVL